MAKIIPKNTADEAWKQLEPSKSYAIRALKDESVYLRLGKGKSIFLSLEPLGGEGRLINFVSFDNGEETLIRKLPVNSMLTIGRSSDVNVRILHAYISRHHLQLFLDGNILIVKDLESMNGTYFYTENHAFNVDRYLETHDVEKGVDQTIDAVHENFGIELIDFLKRYKEKKGRE